MKMNDSNPEEKRKYPRVNYPCDFTLWPEGEIEEVIMGNAANLSAGGLSAFMYKDFFVGETGEIAIESPHLTEPLHCRYRALRSNVDASTIGEWKNYHKVAIQFLDLEGPQQRALAELVDRLIGIEQQKGQAQ